MSCRSRVDNKLGVTTNYFSLHMESNAPRPTRTDLELALAFYSVLVRQARRRETITYGGLVEQARTMFSTNETVQNAIPVSAGRRLDFVRAFTRQRDLPDLTSLVVNKVTGECGAGFTRSFDPEDARWKVFSFDWEGVSDEFSGVVVQAQERLKSSKPKKPMTYDQAAKLMSEYYMKNRAALPEEVRASRERLVELILSGVAPSDAFAEVLK